MKRKNFVKYIPVFIYVMMSLFSSCTDSSSSSPTIDDRDKFAGSWICKETIGSGSSAATTTFTIDVTKFGSNDSVYMKNFSNYGNSAVALGLVTGNSLTIPNQNIGITNIPVFGSGIYSGSTNATEKITMNYMTDGQSANAICTRH